VARQELLLSQERVREIRQTTTTQQKEVETLRGMLKVSNEELKRVEDENNTLRLGFEETTQGAFYKAVQEKTFATLDMAQAEVNELKARLQASPPHRSDTEFVAIRALLKTANAEKEALHAELKAVQAAYNQTDQGIQLIVKQKEIQKLHGILCMLMGEIDNPKLVEGLVENMLSNGVPSPAQVMQFAQSVKKRTKKTTSRK
jgi:hypothetical protein